MFTYLIFPRNSSLKNLWGEPPASRLFSQVKVVMGKGYVEVKRKDIDKARHCWNHCWNHFSPCFLCFLLRVLMMFYPFLNGFDLHNFFWSFCMCFRLRSIMQSSIDKNDYWINGFINHSWITPTWAVFKTLVDDHRGFYYPIYREL